MLEKIAAPRTIPAPIEILLLLLAYIDLKEKPMKEKILRIFISLNPPSYQSF
jgi:hypothetical protein